MTWYEYFVEEAELEGSIFQIISIILAGILVLILFGVSVKLLSMKKDPIRRNTISAIYNIYGGIAILLAVQLVNAVLLYTTPYSIRRFAETAFTSFGLIFVLYGAILDVLITVKLRTIIRNLLVFVISVAISLLVLASIFFTINIFYQLPIGILRPAASLFEMFAVIFIGAAIVLILERRNIADNLTKVKMSFSLIGILALLINGVARVTLIISILVNQEITVISGLYLLLVFPVIDFITLFIAIFNFYFTVSIPKRALIRSGIIPDTSKLMMEV